MTLIYGVNEASLNQPFTISFDSSFQCLPRYYLISSKQNTRTLSKHRSLSVSIIHEKKSICLFV
jgi:hypothetical protein